MLGWRVWWLFFSLWLCACGSRGDLSLDPSLPGAGGVGNPTSVTSSVGGSGGTGGGTGTSTATNTAVTTGTSTSTSTGSGGTPGGCMPPLTECAGQCVDLATAPRHCGGCGLECDAGAQCVAGACEPCPEHSVLCDGVCIDPLTNLNFCGASADCTEMNRGQACDTLELCQRGSCVDDDALLGSLTVTPGFITPAFVPTFTRYSAQVPSDTPITIEALPREAAAVVTMDGMATTSVEVSLAPGESLTLEVVVVGPSQRSSSYTLRLQGCRAGLAACSDGCVDLAIAAQHCGSCENACGAAQVCQSGGCVDNDAALAELEVSLGVLSPPFRPDIANYVVHVPFGSTELTLKARASSDTASLSVNGALAGSSVSLPITLDADGATQIEIVVSARSQSQQTYTVTVVETSIDINSRLYIKADNADSSDWFGWSVAVDGDTLVVGAPREAGDGEDAEDNTRPESGAVYVYRRVNDIWALEAYLKAQNPARGARFGWSVALEGDVLVVGAPMDSANENQGYGSGIAYVFERTGNSWSQQARIQGVVNDDPVGFGLSVALRGNLLVVGAPWESSAATGINGNELDASAYGAGAAYVFRRTGNTWNKEAYIKATDTLPLAQFGAGLALEGNRLVVGAAGYDPDAAYNSYGAVYVLEYQGANWTHQAQLRPLAPEIGDHFGTGLALDGNRLFVGAPGLSYYYGFYWSDRPGAVYVFELAANSWQESTRITPIHGDSGDGFGARVAFASDTLVVAAPHEPSNALDLNGDQANMSANDSGAVFLYRDRSGDFQQEGYLKAINTDEQDLYSHGFGFDGETLVVGAPQEDGNGRGFSGDPSDNSRGDSGAVHAYPVQYFD